MGGKWVGMQMETVSQANTQVLVFYCMDSEEQLDFLKQDCIKLYL